VRIATSSRFGVTSDARGNSSSTIADTASGSSRGSPEVATITGSSTYGRSECERTPSATARTTSASPSIPDLIAAGRRSAATASIWARTSAGDTRSHARTPSVFCAVTAVIADVPNTPNRMNVFRSAWMPAPPPESEPAIVSAITRGESAMKRKMRRATARRISNCSRGAS
jgi:hypothetical protein